MVLDHPQYYTDIGIEGIDDSADNFIRKSKFSEGEHRLAVFAMHHLSNSRSYADLIDDVCNLYRSEIMSLRIMQDLLQLYYPMRHIKYPFFILDYKEPAVQQALDKFIAVPTIPDGLKEMARKIKDGTLATQEEMDEMEGYRAFRKTHFTLYETISPRK